MIEVRLCLTILKHSMMLEMQCAFLAEKSFPYANWSIVSYVKNFFVNPVPLIESRETLMDMFAKDVWGN